MTWTTFVTVWIVLQTVIKAAKQPKLCRLEGKPEAHVVGGVAGSVLWGAAMIGSLYMAGLYT